MTEVKPLRVSWSAIRTAEECKMKSALQRDGRRTKVTNVRNFFAGIVVDRIMRDWLDNPLIRHADTQALVRSTIVQMEGDEKSRGNMVKWRDAEDRNTVQNFCVELIKRLEPILEEHVLPYPYEHGKWFKVPMTVPDPWGKPRDILLTGEMDLLIDNDGWVIWDLKGTADDQYWRKVVAQLTFYDLAMWASTGKKSRFAGLIQPMCSEQLLAWTVTDEARRNLMSRIVRFAHDAWQDVRECTANTGVCHWCDVRHACPRFGRASLDAFGTLSDGLRRAAGDLS